MGNRIKYLLKNTSLFAIGELGSKLINFFLVPLYTYILTAEEYGTVDLIFTISTVIIPLVMFNIGEAIMRYALDKDANHENLLSIGIVSIIFGVIISLLIIPICSHFSIISNYCWYMYFYVILSATKTVVTCYLRGKEKLKLYVSCNLLNTFLIAILNVFFLAVLHKGIKGYLTAYILAEVIAIIYALTFGKIYKDIKKFKFDKNLCKAMILFSLAVVPNSLLWWVINSSDRIMVTAIRNVAENGLLAVSYKLPSILTMINTILMQAWKYSAIKEKDSKDKDEFSNKMFNQFLRASMLISACLILTIKPLTKILFAESYYMSWESSVFLLIGFILMGLSTFVGTIYYVEKNMVGNMLSALCGGVVNIVLNALLIPKMGAAGATLAATICYFVILIYRYFDTKKYQNIHLFKKEYILMFTLIIIMTLGNFMSAPVGLLVSIFSFVLLLLINYNFIIKYINTGIEIIQNMTRKITNAKQ